MKWNVNEEHAGLLLRDYLMNVVGISKRLLTAVKFEEGKLLVNDQEVNVRYTLKENDQIEVVFPAEKRSELLVAEDIPIDIVYEDVALLVLNKKANIVTLPSRLHPCHTLANGVIYYYDQQQITYTVHVVTRLDRDTSGLLLIAKNRYIHSILFRDQHQHTINRKYQAIVTGLLQEKKRYNILSY
ncbi:ribosomal large subunit pseudouridine synthase D [Gracilibacillus boraciitolerans JCM 21714]|uniref:RNA pseudouridylate synthase n=1 Tax=Gracilibacillus boraciitolerans JCM 21714 TaxID=1298598 RepID=W4VNE9_9BACI|nr:ribosomal large subunit pseudouridine synthase D [Gracilibacillus boraciitolerans JCM 21714]